MKYVGKGRGTADGTNKMHEIKINQSNICSNICGCPFHKGAGQRQWQETTMQMRVG